jgi:hypothetical protein
MLKSKLVSPEAVVVVEGLLLRGFPKQLVAKSCYTVRRLAHFAL